MVESVVPNTGVFPVFPGRAQRCVAGADRKATAVPLRQLYSPLRLYTNSLHPILQQGAQWPHSPAPKAKHFSHCSLERGRI